MLGWLEENWAVLLSSQGAIAAVITFIRNWRRRCYEAKLNEAHTIVIATSDVKVAMDAVGVLQRNRIGPQKAAKLIILYRRKWTCDALRRNRVDYVYRIEGVCSRTREHWVTEIGEDVFQRMLDDFRCSVGTFGDTASSVETKQTQC